MPVRPGGSTRPSRTTQRCTALVSSGWRASVTWTSCRPLEIGRASCRERVWSEVAGGSSRRRHTRLVSDWSSDVCSSDLKSTSELLARERDVTGVGVETVGTDAGQAGRFDPPFPNHATMHGAGKFGLASLRNLDELPPTGDRKSVV